MPFRMFSPLLSWVLTFPTLCKAIASSPDAALSKRQAPTNASLLSDFQVYEPVLTPSGPSNKYGCVYTQTLMVHDFSASYGDPFVGRHELRRSRYLPLTAGKETMLLHLAASTV